MDCSISITPCELWDSAWSYAKEYSKKYTLIDLFQTHVPETERQLNRCKNPTELMLMGAKENLKSLLIQIVPIFLIQNLLLNIPAYKNSLEELCREFRTLREELGPTRMFVYAAIIGPLAEEIIFRGSIQNLLSRINPKIAMIITHFIFGIIHMSPQTVTIIFNSGIESSLYYRTDSIWASLGSHMMNNAVFFGSLLYNE